MKPSCLFIGLGGAGQRHLRLFKTYFGNNFDFLAFRKKSSTPLLNADFSVNKSKSLETHYNLKLFNNLDDALNEKPTYVVICTPTSHHISYAIQAAKAGAHILLEKPFSHNLEGFDEFKTLITTQKSHFILSFQRRFHPFSQKIKSILDQNKLGKIYQVNIQVSSYVPFWHPYEDFKNLYACRKDLGGGVLLTECHELDLCYWFFGMPNSLYCTGKSVANLDVEDTVHLILNYETFSVNLTLSFMHKHQKRLLSFSGELGAISCDFVNPCLDVTYFDCSKSSFKDTAIVSNDEPFISQLDFFMNSFSVNDSTHYLNTAQATMNLILAAQKSLTNQNVYYFNSQGVHKHD